METVSKYPGAYAALEALARFLAAEPENQNQVSKNIEKSLSAFAAAIDALTNEKNIRRMQNSAKAISAMIDRLSELCIDTSTSDDFVVLDEATVEILQEAAPLIPEEKRGEYKEIVTPKKGESKKSLPQRFFAR